MGHLTFSLNVTLDGCIDQQEAIADDARHRFLHPHRVRVRRDALGPRHLRDGGGLLACNLRY